MPHAEKIERKSSGGRIWSVSWECSNCRGKVDRTDKFCRSCGGRMVGSDVPKRAAREQGG